MIDCAKVGTLACEAAVKGNRPHKPSSACLRWLDSVTQGHRRAITLLDYEGRRSVWTWPDGSRVVSSGSSWDFGVHASWLDAPDATLLEAAGGADLRFVGLSQVGLKYIREKEPRTRYVVVVRQTAEVAAGAEPIEYTRFEVAAYTNAELLAGIARKAASLPLLRGCDAVVTQDGALHAITSFTTDHANGEQIDVSAAVDKADPPASTL